MRVKQTKRVATTSIPATCGFSQDILGTVLVQSEQIFVEYQDRYEQAGTYHQLGRVAQKQRKWEEAIRYLLQALELYVEYDDGYSTSGTLRNLARLWRDSGDT